jgi:hypothetical protein
LQTITTPRKGRRIIDRTVQKQTGINDDIDILHVGILLWKMAVAIHYIKIKIKNRLFSAMTTQHTSAHYTAQMIMQV